MIELLTIGLIGLALCVKKRGVSGIGKVERVKRRIYKEIAAAQKLGVDFDLKYSDLSNSQLNSLEEVGHMFGWKQTKRSIESGKLYTEAYYNSLKRAYNAIAGIGIGATDYNTHTIRNGKGKIILQWREYNPVVEHLQQEPIVQVIEEKVTDPIVHLTKQQEILKVWPYLKVHDIRDEDGYLLNPISSDDFNYVLWTVYKDQFGKTIFEGAKMAFRSLEEANRVLEQERKMGRKGISVKHISKINPEKYL